MTSSYERHGSYVESLGSPRVFAHDIDTLRGFQSIIEQVPGIRRYDRAISIARRDDVVILKYKPEETYLDWLTKVGLGSQRILVLDGHCNQTLPERIISNGSAEQIQTIFGNEMKNAVFSPYYGGALEKAASDHLGLFMYSKTDVVEELDSKIRFQQICRKLGIPVLDGGIISRNQKYHEIESAINNALCETGTAILKGEFGASASSTHVISSVNRNQVRSIFANNPHSARFLVEPFFKTFSSPSSVWFIKRNKEIVHIRTSNQILEHGISHIGNEFPVRFNEKLVDLLSLRFAEYLSDRGFIGPFGLDYIETNRGITAVECNPRMTGAIYPWELVYILKRNGPVRAARSENIVLPLSLRTFNRIRNVWHSLMYDGFQSEGVIIPYNVGPISTGKVTVLVTGSSHNEVVKILGLLKNRLKVQS